MVECTLDTLPELTGEWRKERARLDALRADQINTSDSPELTDQQWAGAVRGRFYRPIKQQITAQLDADVLAWSVATRDTQPKQCCMIRQKPLPDRSDQSGL